MPVHQVATHEQRAVDVEEVRVGFDAGLAVDGLFPQVLS